MTGPAGSPRGQRRSMSGTAKQRQSVSESPPPRVPSKAASRPIVAGAKNIRDTKQMLSTEGLQDAVAISEKFKDLPRRYRAMVNELCDYLAGLGSGPQLVSAMKSDDMRRDDWELVEGWVQRKARTVVSTARSSSSVSPVRVGVPTRGDLSKAADDMSLGFLTASEIEVLQVAISSHMRNGRASHFSGFTQKDFHDFLVGTAPEIARKSDVIFEAVDADKSGDISFLEFVAALLSTRKAAEASGTLSRTPLQPGIAPRVQPPGMGSLDRADSMRESVRSFKEWIAVLEGLRQQMHVLSMIGSPTDDDLELLEQRKRTYDNYKRKCAKGLESEDSTSLEGDMVSEVSELLSQLCREGDDREGSLDLATALVNKFGLEPFAPHMESSDLLYDLCVDGNLNLLTMFLETPGCASLYDPLLLLQSASYSQAKNKLALLDAVIPKVDMSANTDDFNTVCEEIFVDLIPLQESPSRFGVMERLFKHPLLKLNLEVELVFVPCCRYGDLPLLELLLKYAPHVVQPTKLLDDGTAPLVHAVMHNHTMFVTRVLTLPDLQLDVEMETGTLLGVAEALGKKQIFDLFKRAGATVLKCTL